MLLDMSERRRVTVVIDSNAIWNDWWLESRAWTRLKLLSEHGLVEVCVPEVVVQEVARGYKRELNNLVAALNDIKLWKLQKLLELNVSSTVNDLKESTAKRISDYEPALRARLAVLGITVLPVPVVDQQTMLTRALANRKPFDGEGKNGFRDALIWHTILEVCHTGGNDAKILFVTNNTSDFCAGSKDKLHATLESELTEADLPLVAIALDRDAAVRHLRDVEQLDSELDLHEFPVVTPSYEHIKEIVTAACDKLNDQSVTTAEPLEYVYAGGTDFSGFRTVIEDDATLQDVQPDLDTLTWTPGGRDLDGRPVIEVSLDATFTLDGMAFKGDYYVSDDEETSVWDSDWNDHYMWVATHHHGRLSLLVYLTRDGMDFDAVELEDAEEIISEATSAS